MSFQTLGLGAELLRALSEAGYAEPTPIQAQAILRRPERERPRRSCCRSCIDWRAGMGILRGR